MKKQILLTISSLCMAVAANASSFTFSDADYFGTIHTTGGTNPPNGSPNGVTLTFGGSASASSTFDFVDPDSTPSFDIGTPYNPVNVRGTYSSQLGFLTGGPQQQHVTGGFVTLFLRDPSNGDEGIRYTSELGSMVFNNDAFTTQLVISQDITAQVAGIINTDGEISYTVMATSGSFILDAAYMEITATPDNGSSLMLLGCGLVAMEGLRRRLGFVS